MSTKAKSNRQDIDAIAVLQKQRDYLEPRLSHFQQVGRDNDEKLSAIQAELATLAASLGTIRSDINTSVHSNQIKSNFIYMAPFLL